MVPYPKGGGHNYRRCKFVYNIKIDCYKSRLVVDGSKQVTNVDYTKSFAPFIRYTTLRIFLAIVAIHCMTIHQLDVASAFIYAPLQKDVYMHTHLVMLRTYLVDVTNA